MLRTPPSPGTALLGEQLLLLLPAALRKDVHRGVQIEDTDPSCSISSDHETIPRDDEKGRDPVSVSVSGESTVPLRVPVQEE